MPNKTHIYTLLLALFCCTASVAQTTADTTRVNLDNLGVVKDNSAINYYKPHNALNPE